MTRSQKPRTKPTRPPKRKPTRVPASRPTPARTAKTQTLMKVSSGEGWRNWVTVRVPAWLLLGCALLVLVCVLTLLFSPDFAARVAVAVYEFIQHFMSGQK